jgi:hypothetical protein
MSKLREVLKIPLILISCGFWMVLAFIRGQKIKYHQWRIRRFKEKIVLTQQMKSKLDKRMNKEM